MTQMKKESHIEALGIERVLPHQRKDHRIFNNLTLWLSANFNLSTLALGSLAIPVFKLGILETFAAIVIFNFIAAFPVSVLATLGPKLGLRQMTISRFSFGWSGAKVMALFNAATCIGWSTVNVMVGGQLAQELSHSLINPALAILILSLLTMIVSLYGYKYIHLYERFAWLPMVVIFIILFKLNFSAMAVTPAKLAGTQWIAAWLSFGAAVFGYAVAWASYAADYNVNQPETTPPKKVFWLTYLGISIPCILLETLGASLTTIGPFKEKTGGILLAASTQTLGALAPLILFFFVLSLIAANVPNDYSLGLSLQLLGQKWRKISRALWTVLGTIAYVLIAIISGTGFNDTLTEFLLLITYWLAPWTTIMLIEHFYFRRGQYDIEHWNTPHLLPKGRAALFALFLGLVGSYLGASQALFVGPVSRLLSNADIGFELGVVFSGCSYFYLRGRT